jgi:hypothetical protein
MESLAPEIEQANHGKPRESLASEKEQANHRKPSLRNRAGKSQKA